ncbi:hypothetical protein T10_2039 [Trichinella papuae]|uniref:Uncharacterized protein n=1 Tax=Trichinella papuae TaxID=268474 RepID=A0A0V1NAX4_9BILA|nr:hypothetical protein T10_2039 [Trichinella papuae]
MTNSQNISRPIWFPRLTSTPINNCVWYDLLLYLCIILNLKYRLSGVDFISLVLNNFKQQHVSFVKITMRFASRKII